jgi:WhiB family transcriptional regulator, redox-sensing transcriptional regulator
MAGRPLWQERAACARTGQDPELWYSMAGPGGATSDDLEYALAVCRTACPVRSECLAWAVATGDKWAILGGTTAAARDPKPRRHR